MCGIIGYAGKDPATEILLEGLKKLEYRGYDSAGIALLEQNDEVFLEKCKGRIARLEQRLKENRRGSNATLGIAHTRWATHGEPSGENAHPHSDCQSEFFLVHNGIIENFPELRSEMLFKGHVFRSETDTEVLCHLIEQSFRENSAMDLKEAVLDALRKVEGAYGIAVISPRDPGKIVVAKLGSPLVIGLSEDGSRFVASDPSAFVEHTKDVIFLEEGQLAVLEQGKECLVTDLKNITAKVEIEKIDWDEKGIDRGGYSHFMLKEIFEQPRSLVDTLRGRLCNGEIILGGLRDHLEALKKAKRVYFIGCGTSMHAALVGQKIMKNLLGIPIEVEYASEFRYDDPALEDSTIVIVISQSGETADTLAALRLVKKYREERSLEIPVFGIVNAYGSTIARETDAGVYLHCGPEIGVASTKSFTSQLAVICLITFLMMKQKGIDKGRKEKFDPLVKALEKIPAQMELVLGLSRKIEKLALQYQEFPNFLYLGRKCSYPVALEGALKLKEIAYVHAEGYPGAEMKHGPIALFDENMPVIMVVPDDSIRTKMISNIQEVRARIQEAFSRLKNKSPRNQKRIIAVASEGDREIWRYVDDVIYVPRTEEWLTPFFTVVALQLFAYHAAVLRGLDVDKPRNLAKSVTVE